MNAATAATRMIEAVEAGGSAVCMVLLTGSGEASAGRRLLLLRDASDQEHVMGSLGDAHLDTAAAALARQGLVDLEATDGLVETEAGAELYREIRRPIPELVIVGAGHIAQPLSSMGALLGFRVLVVDDRPDFATNERFPDADRVVRVDFSDPFRELTIHRESHVLLVTRGHRYDYDCLVRLLRAEPRPAYIGMIGSRRRVRATYVQLLEDGIGRDRLDWIHAPVGLDVGAETPAEIAVAVAAELVLVRRGGSGRTLTSMARVAERYFDE